jgi:hypothetical protein
MSDDSWLSSIIVLVVKVFGFFIQLLFEIVSFFAQAVGLMWKGK